jgi:hypothetical protein
MLGDGSAFAVAIPAARLQLVRLDLPGECATDEIGHWHAQPNTMSV